MVKIKNTILALFISVTAYAQGGPPPGNACNTPNPPPWCDTPGVPIDNWWLMTLLIVTGGIIGVVSLKRMKNNVETGMD